MKRLVLAAWLSLALVAPLARAATPEVTGEFDLGEMPHHLTLGPDGNVWVALEGSDVARVKPDGTVTTFTVPDIAGPGGITTGPDGNLWVTQSLAVVRFSPTDPENTGTKFPADIVQPQAITVGPDGDLWTASADKVIRITATGTPTNFPVLSSGRGIAAGTDGNLYVAEFGDGSPNSQGVVRVTTSGTPTLFPTGGGPQEVATGAPGGPPIAFSDPGAVPQTVGFVTAGAEVQKTDVPMTDPFGIVLGDDGAHWIANFAKDTLSRLAPDRTVTTLTGFSAGSGPRHITVGANHTLWVGLETAKRIARVSGVEPPPQPQPQPQPQPEPQPQPPPAVDTTPPALTKVSLRKRARRKTAPVVRFTLSETARITLTLQRRHGRHLTRVLRRTITLAAGPRRVALRLPKGRHLKLGRYRLTLAAQDIAGNRAKPVRRAFTVVR